MFRVDSLAESSSDIFIDQRPRMRREVARGGVLVELELGPDDQMRDLGIDAVGPVVDEDLDVIFLVLQQRKSISRNLWARN